MLAPRAGPGRPRLFCAQGCRQRHYEARQRARELGVGEAELIVARAALEELSDRLYVLECAVDDVVRDLEAARTVAEHREALEWLLEAARQVLDHPVAGPGPDFT